MRPIQFFSDEYLDQCRTLSATEIIEFLEDIRVLSESVAPSKKSKLISIKIPESLLKAFKVRCLLEGIRYQTKIKELMCEYLKN